MVACHVFGVSEKDGLATCFCAIICHVCYTVNRNEISQSRLINRTTNSIYCEFLAVGFQPDCFVTLDHHPSRYDTSLYRIPN